MWKEITMNMWLIRHFLGPSITGSSSQQIFVVYLLWAWNSASFVAAKINKTESLLAKSSRGLGLCHTDANTLFSCSTLGPSYSSDRKDTEWKLWRRVICSNLSYSERRTGYGCKGAGNMPVNSAPSRTRKTSPSKDRQRTFMKILVGEQTFGDL